VDVEPDRDSEFTFNITFHMNGYIFCRFLLPYLIRCKGVLAGKIGEAIKFWPTSAELREMGLSKETIIALVKAGIRRRRQLAVQTYTRLLPILTPVQFEECVDKMVAARMSPPVDDRIIIHLGTWTDAQLAALRGKGLRWDTLISDLKPDQIQLPAGYHAPIVHSTFARLNRLLEEAGIPVGRQKEAANA
jgi:hypothetical protein